MLLRFSDLTTASRAAADMIRERAKRAVEDRGWFSLALSGGESPKELFRLLAGDEELPWPRTHVFWADERLVPPDSPHSNVHLARSLLLSRVPIPEANVHAPDTSLSPAAAAREYEQCIRGVLSSLQHGNGSMPSLDVILLGLGRDGHTASLFPGSLLLAERTALVAAVPAAGSPPVARLTMTLPLINAAKAVIFLLAGEEKIDLLEAILAGQRSDAPAAMIKPDGELYWLVAERQDGMRNVRPGSMTTGSVILFTRFPRPGRTKTRLISALGPDGAARFQEAMTGYTLLKVRSFSVEYGSTIQVRFDGAGARRMRKWLGPGMKYLPQGPGDLGRRMARALHGALRSGHGRAVLVGCDCPGLDHGVLRAAFEALERHDVVLGPAEDGGYYLVGLRAPAPFLFEGIAWGTDQVLARTLEIAAQHGLSVAQVAILPDVDHPVDLPAWERAAALTNSRDTGSISVIIPALNEEAQIARTISRACDGALEVIVADGGSRDRSVELARLAGARVVHHPYGRAAQMNAAALAARGEILLFLHADTLLPHGWALDVREALCAEDVAAGAFSLGIDGHGRGYRLVEAMTNARSRLLGLPYGDQALFMRREDFLRLGGYAHMPIMEDYELVRRLGRMGRMAILPARVSTSGRRWARLGVARTTAVNQMMVLGYWLGIPGEHLAAYYRRKKR